MKADEDATPIRMVEDLPELVTRRELAEFTGISTQTLARWVVEDRGPAMTKLGSAARYRRADVLAWIEASRGIRA
jgi:excisionase family DNA binding protein